MLRSRTSAALRLSLGVLAFLVACSSQAQAASAMGRAELSTAGPWEFPFDRTVELEKPLPEVNFFDSKVFNYSYYLAQNPNITTEGVFDYRSARNHWLHVGMFKGLQAAPGFDVKVYLAKNRDIERYFGPTNYPFAVIHYLSRGHLEKYRETGGPLETDIYSPLVFDHRYYTRKHSLVAPNTPTGYINESEARAHWREIGLPKGLQASSHFSPKTYLMLNPDVRTRYGADAYAAAVSHFISWGHKQTWRENGGTSCKYWATWCQVPDSAFTKLLKRVPRLPTFITNGTSISTPPIPSYAGRSVRINGRECSDLHGVERRSAAVSRVRDSISLSWPSYNGTRGCEITIRHFIDIQTRISNQRVPDLSLSHWAFDETIPSQVLDEPLPTPALLKYAGFSYAMPRPEKPKPKPLPDMSKVTLPLPEPSNATAPAAQNSTANSSSTNSSSNATAGANSTVTPIAPRSNASGPVVLMAPSSPEPTFHLSKAPSHFRVGISLLREQQMKDEDDVPADQKLKPTKVYSVVHHYELNPKGKVPEVQQKDGTVGVAGPAEMVDHFVAVDPSEEGKLGSDLLRFRRKNAIAQAAAQSQHHQRARHHRYRRHKIHARHH